MSGEVIKPNPPIVADVRPPDSSADAAAWQRIDRALRSTRKWLWVFVVLTALASGFAWWRVMNAELDPYSGDPVEAHVSVLVTFAIFGLASGIATLSLLTTRVSQIRSRPGNGPVCLHLVMKSQAFMWWALGAMSVSLVVFFVVIGTSIFLDEWRNGSFWK